VKQTQKLLEHNRFERKIQQLTFPMDMEITIPQDDPVRLASALWTPEPFIIHDDINKNFKKY
jgi:hypothetical protein